MLSKSNSGIIKINQPARVQRNFLKGKLIIWMSFLTVGRLPSE
jgi:hypothetical protein